MIFEYRCDCGEEIKKELTMADEIPKTVKCAKCGKRASRVWSNMTLHVPESMKPTSDLYNGDNGSNSSYLKERMNKGARPSGKKKIYY